MSKSPDSSPRLHGSPDNYLLELLDGEARSALCLVPVELAAGTVLYRPGTPARSVYFPVSAVISLVSLMKTGASAEIALIGREGMAGLAGMLGALESPTTAVVQIAGAALKTTSASLRTARLQSPSVRTILDRYTEIHLIQTSQTAACNTLHSAEARLARWLLAIDDRIDGDQCRFPQEIIAHMLGLQRPTVSVTMHRLQESKAIAYRGRAIVVDRPRLERIACECYGVLRREFERLRDPFVDGPSLPSRPSASRPANGESAVSLETMRQIAGRLLVSGIREQEAREDAEAANRAKDQFLAMASHELRTPLNVILGCCAILARPDRESADQGVRIIQQNATAQLKLVEDLLDAVGLASSTLAIRAAVVDLGDLVQDAVDTAKPMADEKQVTLRLAIVDGLSPLLADADRLRQVFLNVVTNAVKFTDAGGSIDVSVGATKRAAQVTVRDTGHGIAAEMLPHVFERFRKGARPAGGTPGLGLGLTIAHALVELHGGRLQLASAGEGLGTTCTIELPLRADAAPFSSRAARDAGAPR